MDVRYVITHTGEQGPGGHLMGTNVQDWINAQKAKETPAEREYRERLEAGITLGLQFHDARTEAGLTQRQLAEQAGVRQADVSRIERGAGNPTESTLQRTAAALGGRIELVIPA
jgi:XRE family transcriptional regulator, regulator of sulfur utilization